MKIFVPGLPIKKNSPCVDPQQSPIPHVISVLNIENLNNKQKYTETSHTPNLEDYPEYEDIIKVFIEEQKLNELK